MPLLLVGLALGVGSASPSAASSSTSKPGSGGGLALTRAAALFGAPALLSASPGARQATAGELAAYLDAYPAVALEDSNAVGGPGGDGPGCGDPALPLPMPYVNAASAAAPLICMVKRRHGNVQRMHPLLATPSTHTLHQDAVASACPAAPRCRRSARRSLGGALAHALAP